MNWKVFDIETDGLDGDKIHCVSVGQIKDRQFVIDTYTKKEEIKRFFLEGDEMLVGHNILRFDSPFVERVLGINIKRVFVDTLGLSWYLYPNRFAHGLESWGETYGIEKPPVEDWDNLPIEDYIHRCEQDVRINGKMFYKMLKKLRKIYESEEGVQSVMQYLTFKMHCAALMEQQNSKWVLRQDLLDKNLERFEYERNEKIEALKEAMPKVVKYTDKVVPKVLYKKNGELSVAGEEWMKLVKERGHDCGFLGPIRVVAKEEEPNPQSGAQVKEWLFSLGWEPETFEFRKDKQGVAKKVPQIYVGDEVCESVKRLYGKCPELENLNSLGVLKHRIGILKGFNRDKVEGRVCTRIAGFANTLRMKHAEVVNIPGKEKPHSKEIRECLSVEDGYEFVSSDIVALEDTTKQAYIYHLDPGYVEEQQQPGYDPHLKVAEMCGLLTKEQCEQHKNKEADYSSERFFGKRTNFSAVYGVGPETLAKQLGKTKEEARTLLEGYWKLNWAVKEVEKSFKTKEVDGEHWIYNPISCYWYSLRDVKDKFSVVNQSSGDFVFNLWLKRVVDKRKQLTNQVHDSLTLKVKTGYRELVEKFLQECMDEVNKTLNLPVTFKIDNNFGENYWEAK
jgi:hypothetical protein